MSTHGQMMKLSIVAGEDLSGAQYRAVEVDGTIAATSTVAIGLVQNKPRSGEHAEVAFMGHMKGLAGDDITLAARLMITTSGYLLTRTGSGTPVGIALTTATSGGTVEILASFPNAIIV